MADVRLPADVAATQRLLAEGGYVADRQLATTIHLALRMHRPIFLEGEPGTGKTEIAKVLAAQLPRRLVRLQCYDGMDLASAAYEWNHARQLMAIRLAEASGEATDRAAMERGIYDRRFLQSRPLLDALEGEPAVLLIDELDRADEPFEAFLLEILADFQLSIPELGVVKAATPPVVVITSNRTREVHDAIRRRCLYHWVDYPDAARERAILKIRAPQVGDALSAQVVAFVQAVRGADTFKPPGVAETIDWAAALSALDARELEPALVDETLGALLKYQDDIAKIRGAEAARLVAEAKQVETRQVGAA
ncbi:MoxR family ATPase [Roseomonas frigidaquae]|uniref:MoxR family ATPase n=1 Tax=Falsiroseomonas frigidaquae TaxID=487318 RepID=A0ABX1F5W9_9PROT|nr:MoxR family ATPase [Falsiroseomonas frigidaquae]NKE47650.1 MoxR family ATPase [Falsiroseomonas frigidaquae]